MKKALSVPLPRKRFLPWVSLAPSPRPFCAKTRIRHWTNATEFWNRLRKKQTKQGWALWLTFRWHLETPMAILGMRRRFARHSINLSVSVYGLFRLLTQWAWRVLILLAACFDYCTVSMTDGVIYS